jgi:hypothetical protein
LNEEEELCTPDAREGGWKREGNRVEKRKDRREKDTRSRKRRRNMTKSSKGEFKRKYEENKN